MDQLDELFRQIDAAYESCAPALLEERLLAILSEGCRLFGEDSPEAASLFSELGSYYRGSRNLAASERSYGRAVSVLKERCGEDDPNYATALSNLAGTHRLMRRFEEAEEEFQRCLDCFRRTVGKRHILYASGLNNLSLLRLDQGDLPGAAALLNEASEILAGLPDKLDERAASLVNLGVLYYRSGELKAARCRLEEAVSLYEDKLGTATPHYHAALRCLALICGSQGEPLRARDILQKALAAARRIYGESHPEVQALEKQLEKLSDQGGDAS